MSRIVTRMIQRAPTSAATFLAVSLILTTAYAQETAYPAADAQASFVLMSPVDVETRVGVDVGFTVYDELLKGANSTVDLYGQYVGRGGGGAFAKLPVTYLGVAEGTRTKVGNLELGGLWVTRAGGLFRTIITASMVAGLSSDDEQTWTVLHAGMVALPRDAVLRAPNTWWARLGVSPVLRHQIWTARMDIGYDQPVKSGKYGKDLSGILRFSAGAGVDPGWGALLVEIINLEGLDEVDWLQQVGVTAQARLGRWRPALVVAAPLNGTSRNLLDFTVLASLRVH